MSKSKKSLSTLVGIYKKQFAPRIEKYLRFFENLNSLDDAIRVAALATGKDGKIHGHQRRVGRKILTKTSKKLLRHTDELGACETFDDLLNCVEDKTQRIERFGELAVYDTSLRVGAHLGLWPELVYLHAGTKKGCKALGVDASNGIIEMGDLPKPIRTLAPYQTEDFLCIFKGSFDVAGESLMACLPKGRGVV